MTSSPLGSPAAQPTGADLALAAASAAAAVLPSVEPLVAAGAPPQADAGDPVVEPSATPAMPSAVPSDGVVTPLPRRGIEMLHGVDMEVTVELGRTRMTVRDLLALTPGAVLELDRAAGSPA